jgi:signal transduction histidine kinase
MAEKQSESQMQLRIKRRIAYIDAMMQWAHDHINGKVQDVQFNAAHEIREVIKILQYKARKSRVKILSTPSKLPALPLYGDPNRFRQLVVNLVSNAVESYNTAPTDSVREVHIECTAQADGTIRIIVRDYGNGIPADIQKSIFDPFYTTKEEGMGIGLFVVKQIAEEYFDGSIQLTSHKGETCFTVTLRRTHEQQNS